MLIQIRRQANGSVQSLDFRRYVRPLFLTANGTPTAYKPIYDILSLLCTQLAFSFAVAPFILLTLSDSFRVWSRVYFYSPVGVALAMVFFASPARSYLIDMGKRKSGEMTMDDGGKTSAAAVASSPPQDERDERTSIMGLPSDPGQELDDLIGEVRSEVGSATHTGKGLEI